MLRIPYKLTFGTRNCKFFSSEPPQDAISIMNPLTHLNTNSARLVHQATVISWNQKSYGLFRILFILTTESSQVKAKLKTKANQKLGYKPLHDEMAFVSLLLLRHFVNYISHTASHGRVNVKKEWEII